MWRRWWAACLAAGVLVMVGGDVGLAQTDAPFELRGPTDGDLVLTDKAEMQLVSNDDETRTVRLRLEPDRLPLLGGGSVLTERVVSVPGTQQLGDRKEETIEVSIRGLDLLDLEEANRGRIVATNGEHESAVAFRLVAPKEAAPADTPAVSKWTVTKTRSWGDDDVKGESLPLKAASTQEGPVTLGSLQDADGDTIVLEGQRAAGGKAITLDLPELEPGTTYSGDVDLVPDDEDAGAVAITVRSTDTVWWALFAMIGGLVLGLLGKRVLGVTLVARRLRYDLDKATELARSRSKSFKKRLRERETADGPPVGDDESWSVQHDELHKSATDAIGRLSTWSAISVDRSSPDYVTASEAIETIEQNAALWGAPAAAEVIELRTAIRELPPDLHFDGQSPAPAFVGAATEHVTARALDIENLKDFRTRTTWLTTSLGGFAETWNEIKALEDTLTEILSGQPNDSDERRARRALQELRAARKHLWDATSADDLVAGRVEERLLLAEDVAAQLAEPVMPPVAAGHARMLMRAALTTAVVPTVDLARLGGAVSDWVRKVSRSVSANRVGLRGLAALAAILLAGLVAVVTGLETVYYDGVFGTSRDYVAAVVWGISAVAVFETLEAVSATFTRPRPAAEEPTATS